MKKTLFTLLLIITLCGLTFAQQESEALKKSSESLYKGDIRGAIAVLDKAVEKGENTFEIYRYRAMLHGMTGNVEAEFRDISKAIELKSTDGAAYEKRAMLRMFLRHDSDLILSDLDLAIANGRKVEKVYSMRAVFRRQKDDIEGALADYRTALGLNPDSAASTVGLASIMEIDKKDDAQAIMILEDFFSRFENSPERNEPVKGRVVAQGGGIVYRDGEKNVVAGTNSVVIRDDTNLSTHPSEEQLRKLTEKLEQTKNAALAYAHLARLYEKRGDFEKALETVEKGIRLDPTDKHGIGSRGKIKASMKNYDGAVVDLSIAIKAMPSLPHNYLERGIVYLMMNRDQDAEKDFARYLELMSVPAAKMNLEKRIAEAKKKREASN